MTYLCIPLYGKRGSAAIVSESAHALVDGYRWYKTKGGYAFSPKVGLMHRRLMAAEPGEAVDHKNFNRLDNRDDNLRCGEPSQNNKHRRKNNTRWPYKGVRKVGHRWQARMTANNKGIHLGIFETAEEAARAYDCAALRLFGQFAVPNFGETK